jgi:hypothetical protein
MERHTAQIGDQLLGQPAEWMWLLGHRVNNQRRVQVKREPGLKQNPILRPRRSGAKGEVLNSEAMKPSVRKTKLIMNPRKQEFAWVAENLPCIFSWLYGF